MGTPGKGGTQQSVIHHFHIDYNAPCLHPPPLPLPILYNIGFQFLLDITVVPREIQDSDYVKFGGNKVHYIWGRRRLDVHPLTLSYTILTETVLLSYNFY